MFKPIQREWGDKSADLFILKEEGYYYLAAFNLTEVDKYMTIDLKQCGIKEEVSSMKDLWNEEGRWIEKQVLYLTLAPKDSTLIKLNTKSFRKI